MDIVYWSMFFVCEHKIFHTNGRSNEFVWKIIIYKRLLALQSDFYLSCPPCNLPQVRGWRVPCSTSEDFFTVKAEWPKGLFRGYSPTDFETQILQWLTMNNDISRYNNWLVLFFDCIVIVETTIQTFLARVFLLASIIQFWIIPSASTKLEYYDSWSSSTDDDVWNIIEYLMWNILLHRVYRKWNGISLFGSLLIVFRWHNRIAERSSYQRKCSCLETRNVLVLNT